MNVSIRPLREEDALISVKWRNIPGIWTFTTFKADHEITLSDEVTWIKKAIADPAARRFAILAEGNYVGNIYLLHIVGRVGEYHIFLGESSAWGKGVAEKASRLLILYAVEVLGLERIELSVHKLNDRALGLYHKLGFKVESESGEYVKMVLLL